MSRMLRNRWSWGIAIMCAAALAVLVIGCADKSPTATQADSSGTSASAELSARVLVSSPLSQLGAGSISAARVAVGELVRSSLAGDDLVYVSLPPGSTTADSAIISNLSTRQEIAISLIAGGFDPVAIPGMVGDALTVDLRTRGKTIALVKSTVPRRRPPTVVRTDPPKGKTDVPLNTRITIVFSEPIDPTSLSGSVRLLQAAGVVAGTVAVTPSGFVAEFVPDAPLSPVTTYELLISTAVRNSIGDALDAELRVPFTTSAVTTGAASLSVSGLPCNITVTAMDESGNVVINYVGTVHFSSSDPAAVLPPDYTFHWADRGTHTFPVTLKTAGKQSVNARDAANSLRGSEAVAVDPTAFNKPLYVSNDNAHSVTVYGAGASCNTPPIATIAGNNTGLDAPAYAAGLAIDALGRVYVASPTARDPGSIRIFGAGANGNIAPVATITDASGSLDSPRGILLDGARQLYVAGGGGGVVVYSADAIGNAPPISRINALYPGSFGIALDATGHLYVSSWIENAVLVFALGATAGSGPMAEIRGSNTGLNGATGIAVDRAGQLYVANAFNSTITIYAAGANGNVSPKAIIAGINTGLSNPEGLALDDTDRLYVANRNSSTITVYPPGTSGNVAPVAMIAGEKTGLLQPDFLALPIPTARP